MTDWRNPFPVVRTPSTTSPVPVPASGGSDIDLREEFLSIVRQGDAAPCTSGGASNLSQLNIDVDKDWEGFSITNLRNLQVIGSLLALGVFRLPIDASATGAGDLRYNSTTKIIEYYDGTNWQAVGTGAGGASDLSDLNIDADKNWGGYGISNLGSLQVVGALLALGVLRLPTDASPTGAGDIRYNSGTELVEYYDGSDWVVMGTGAGGGSELVSSSATSVAEGNNSLTGLADKFVVETIIVETSSTDWTMTVYSKDDYSSDTILILKNRNGSCSYDWDYAYEDKDGTSEFHYNFTDNAGSNTHDIEVLGTSLV